MREKDYSEVGDRRGGELWIDSEWNFCYVVRVGRIGRIMFGRSFRQTSRSPYLL